MAKILIAEDERDIRDLVAFTLRFAGHEVVAVGNGEEAVDTARKEMPDLILMDVRMPRMDGLELCRRVREWSDMPLILVSARDAPRTKEQALELGELHKEVRSSRTASCST